MEFIHQYLWYLNQCFESSALRASQSLLFFQMRHFVVIFKHCVLAFLKMQFCKVFPRKINYFIFVRWTYGASKGAVHTLTKMMALDLSKDKIRVNSLSPTWTWTPEVAKIDPQSNFSQFNLKSRVCGRSYNSWQF